MSERSPDRNLDAKAIDAFIPPGPERTQALNKAIRLRNAAYGYLFSNELTAPT